MKTLLFLSCLIAFTFGEFACEACKGDHEKLCPTAESHEELKTCFRSNWQSLTAECKIQIEQYLHRTEEENNQLAEVCKACHEDKEKFCASAKSHEEIRTCMKANWASLSAGCTSAIEALFHNHEMPHNDNSDHEQKADDARFQVYRACHDDKEKFCSQVNDHSEIRKCMHDNWEKLGEQCRSTIQAVFGHMQLSPEQVDIMHEVHDKCHESREKLCSNFVHFAELRQCMASHWTELPETCTAAITKFSQLFHPPTISHPTPEATPAQPEVEKTQEKVPALSVAKATTATTANTIASQNPDEHKNCPLKVCVVDVESKCAHETTRTGVKDCLLRNYMNLDIKCRHAFDTFVLGRSEGSSNTESTTQSSQSGRPMVNTWKSWVFQLWWTYPLGLVLIIQILACIRVRQIRKEEQAL